VTHPPITDVYGTARFVHDLAAQGLPADAVSRYRTQHEAAHRALDAEGVPRERRRRWVIPGRIEVLGKHTDYAGGRSLLCTVERGLVIVAAPRADRHLVVLDAVRQGRVDIDLASAASLRVSRGWPLYPTTIARRFARNFGHVVGGAHLAMASGLPSAAGMSSSSALTVGIALALAHCGGLVHSDAWRAALPTTLDLAGYLGALENGLRFRSLEGDTGVGTMGGAQDHTAILCSAPAALGMFAWAPPALERWVPWSPSHVFVIGVSGVVASKAGAARGRYNRAARTVAHLLRAWNLHAHRRDATLGQALGSSPDAYDRLRAFAARDATAEFTEAHLVARLAQFRDETDVLVPGAADALARGDLSAFGHFVARSQRGAEQALENQVPETVHLTRSAIELGAHAASAFGAGFGGSVWAMVPADGAEGFAARWRAAYGTAHPEIAARASWLLSRPAPPAREVPTD
jgi:galactokinase